MRHRHSSEATGWSRLLAPAVLAAALGLPVVHGEVSRQAAPAPSPSETLFSAGHLLYDEAARRLLMLNAYLMPEKPVHALLWTWTDHAWAVLPSPSGAPAPSGPSMRTLSAAAYDSARSRVVLFGGLGNNGLDDPRGDTWEWDGDRWHAMAGAGPGARDHHAMAYDAGTRKTVMFGGVSTRLTPTGRVRDYPADTWEWDGSRWTRIDTPGPSPRGATMIYDHARKQVVLFGGIGVAPGAAAREGDTWVWTRQTWRRAREDGPGPRNGHAMVFDHARDRVLLFGGTTGAAHFDDLWQWDGRQWTEITVAGPKPSRRTGAGMVFDTARQRVVLFGGHVRDGSRVLPSNEMWEWDGRAWTRVSQGARRAARSDLFVRRR